MLVTSAKEKKNAGNLFTPCGSGAVELYKNNMDKKTIYAEEYN